MSKTESNNQSCICIKLKRASSKLTACYNRALEPAGITIIQYSVLNSLQKLGVCSVSELASHMGVERTTIARALKFFFIKGYAEDISAEGSRTRRLKITESGEDIYRKAKPLWASAQEEIKKVVGEDGEQFIYDIVNKF